MPLSQGARDALLYWFNHSTFRPESEKVSSLAELADGAVLARLLMDLDPEYQDFSIDPIYRTRNLTSLRKGLVSYFHRKEDDITGAPRLEKQASAIDIQAAAYHGDESQLAEIVALILCVAATGPENQRYVPEITKLSDENPAALAVVGDLVRSRTQDEGGEDEYEVVEDPLQSQSRVLYLEAELAKACAERDRAKRDIADTVTRLEQLQIHHDELLEAYAEKDHDHMLLRDTLTKGTQDQHHIRDLQKKVDERNDYIAQLEATVQDYEDLKLKYQKEHLLLIEKTEKVQQLEDQVQELQYQQQELEKKSNAAENYKKKILQQRDLQIELNALKFENQQLQVKAEASDTQLRELPRLQEVEQRFHQMLHSYETQIAELTDQKKILEGAVREYERKVELFQEQRAHDEKYIYDMQEQLNTQQPAAVTSPGGTRGALSLEEELEGDSVESPTPMNLELSRLKAENQLLRGNMTSAGEAQKLRAELDASEEAKQRLQQKHTDLFEKYAVAQEQITALVDNMTGEGSVAFANMRREKEQSALELARAKARVEELEAQVADKDRELTLARTDLAVVEKDSIDALKELKDTDQLIAASARNELAALQKKYNDIQAEHQSHQNELVKLFMSKEQLARELEEAKEFQAKSHDQSVNEKVDKLRARAKHYKEQLEKAEQEKYDLHRRLKAIQEGNADMEEKATKDQIIKNLQRENAMIATAWYDLNSRLQSNHVVLQRRHDAPKSWLNKQRQIVNATPRR